MKRILTSGQAKWIGISLLLMLVSRALTLAVPLGEDGPFIGYVISAIFTTLSIWVIMAGTAYTGLSRSSFRDSLRWITSHDQRNAIGALVLCPTIMLGIVYWAGQMTLLTALVPTIFICAYIAGYRALVGAYSAARLATESDEYKQNLEAKSSGRRVAEALTGVRYIWQRHRLFLPALQTAIVLYVPQAILVLILDKVAPNSPALYGMVSLPIVALATLIWVEWHRFGGLGRMLKRSKGRPINSPENA